jgi:hypothetical protein
MIKDRKQTLQMWESSNILGTTVANQNFIQEKFEKKSN